VAQARLEFAQEEYQSEHLEVVARAHDRIATLIEDIETLVRNEEADPQLDAIVLRELIEACWQNVETHHATLIIESDRSLLADESRCRQLLENLIRNAVEHAGDAVTVTIGDLENGFYVEDDGQGFPDGDPKALLEEGVTTKATGTGLGLSIVREIVEEHEWTLTMAEGEDDGARFEIRGIEFV
jgi:signal transduction histidine kinase